MTSDAAPRDPALTARELVAQNSYLVLSTADRTGTPWATPVWFASSGLELFVWASKPGARHSRNVAENPRVSFVVFDSSAKPGEGSAFYVSAHAELVPAEAFADSLAVYNAGARSQGLSEWEPAELREPARHRLFRAVAIEAFVLDDHDERVRIG